MDVKKALRISAHPLFTRRAVALTVAALLPYRFDWVRRPGGFEVMLSGALPDGMPWQQTLQLVSRPCHLGGWRHYLVCPVCGQAAMGLFWGSSMFVCRRCARLRYVSANWSDHIRLGHHYGDLKGLLAHRPGRKPPRFGRYEFYELLHWHLGLRGMLGWADRVNARRAKREERGRAAAIARSKRAPTRASQKIPLLGVEAATAWQGSGTQSMVGSQEDGIGQSEGA